MSVVTRSIIMLGLAASAVPAMAQDTDRYEARVAIVQARAKIVTADKAGVNAPAADVQSRARAALAEAQAQYHRHHNAAARAAAERASSLADLALATAQARDADAQRQIAIATPQE